MEVYLIFLYINIHYKYDFSTAQKEIGRIYGF